MRKVILRRKTRYSLVNFVFNFISNSPNGLDESGLIKGVFELFAQMADVRRDGVVVFAVILILPDPPEQLFRADHRALVFQQNTKNGKFGGREEDLFSVQQAAMRLYMKLQAAIGQRRPVLPAPAALYRL